MFKRRAQIVLDIGCGTGVLSIFAARAGAAHVYGVECSEIVGLARRVAEANGCATLGRGRREDCYPMVVLSVRNMGRYLYYMYQTLEGSILAVSNPILQLNTSN